MSEDFLGKKKTVRERNAGSQEKKTVHILPLTFPRAYIPPHSLWYRSDRPISPPLTFCLPPIRPCSGDRLPQPLLSLICLLARVLAMQRHQPGQPQTTTFLKEREKHMHCLPFTFLRSNAVDARATAPWQLSSVHPLGGAPVGGKSGPFHAVYSVLVPRTVRDSAGGLASNPVYSARVSR